MSVILLDIEDFRLKFPKFSDVAVYPDALISMQWDIAVCYVSNEDIGRLSLECRTYAIQMMTAHSIFISDLVLSGNDSTVVQSGSERGVSVSLAVPPTETTWEWWLSSTPYGKMLLSLLAAKSVGGFYVGGSSERLGFRKIGGGF